MLFGFGSDDPGHDSCGEENSAEQGPRQDREIVADRGDC